ncbi:MAG TPA: hypothetical protein VMA75_00100 [Candidatus Paceibacterota bacterium]|nr:hypothetical protein [Candidatus Paceibacterota bacterium]
MANPTPKDRAIVATLIFIAFGVIGAVVARNDLAFAWPPMLFYAMLVWNDYYSIKHFSKIIPPGKASQVIIDIALVVLHFTSALLFGNPFLFAITITVLFILAVLKYAGDLPSVKNSRALYRKVKIDALGALISALTLAGMLIGYPWQATVAWTVIFVCASIYVILINPLYQDAIGTS